MHGVFTNVIWYLEFFAFAGVLIAFFYLCLYLASINYVKYAPRYDFRRKAGSASMYYSHHALKDMGLKRPVDTRPLCYDMGCIWFFRVMASIVTIALCYYFAYALISDTKLKFGLFIP